MKSFNHVNAKSLEEVQAALADGKTELIAGGTDLMGTLKDNLLRTYPANVVNLKSVPGLDFIKEEGGMLKIGATTRLGDIAAQPVVRRSTALSQAASRVALRIRGWGPSRATLRSCTALVFRKPENHFDCKRKGRRCFAVGDNRYHSIFGAVGSCMAVHPSDGPGLIALNARVVTPADGRRRETFDVKVPGTRFWSRVIARSGSPPPAGRKARSSSSRSASRSTSRSSTAR